VEEDRGGEKRRRKGEEEKRGGEKRRRKEEEERHRHIDS
jgi:hypothetical protein